MDDAHVHYAVMCHFIDHGVAPRAEDLARILRGSVEDVEASLVRMAGNRTLSLFPDRREIRMAHPFSALPTPFRVRASGSWWANCAWCAMGILAALGEDGDVYTVCAHCQRPVTWRMRSGAVHGGDSLIHFLVPASQWWVDVVRTCGNILAFDSEEHLGAWLESRGADRGAVLSRDKLWELSLRWYGDRFDRDWKPLTLEQAHALLHSLGLTGDFWRMA